MTQLADLVGRPAVVTGAGSGIGEAFAQHAAEQGLKVLAIDVNGERLTTLRDWATARGAEIRTVVADVSDYTAVEAATTTIKDWGPAGLIVNNAGIELTGRIWETSAEQWNRLQAINVNGYFNIIRAFLPSLLESGKPGHVVMLSSIGGFSSIGNMAGYLCSKTAVRVLAQCLRDELSAAGAAVGVTSVHPGAVRTNIFNDAEASGNAGDSVRVQMKELLSGGGIDPSEVARLTFEGIAEGRFWVHTHPDQSRDAVEAMAADIRSGFDPALT